jgi:predicted  nucleic acid-binding Zn-ribbon protein
MEEPTFEQLSQRFTVNQPEPEKPDSRIAELEDEIAKLQAENTELRKDNFEMREYINTQLALVQESAPKE